MYLCSATWLLDKGGDLTSMSNDQSNKTLIDNNIYQYLLDNTLKQSDTLKNMLAQAQVDDHAMMLTTPEQLQFLALFLKIIGAKKVLEVGCFRGVGTLAMAEALPEDGEIYALDITSKYLENYRKYWDKAGVAHKIKLQIKPAIDSLKILEQEHINTFDFIYIDADKERYEDYYQHCYNLLNTGGVMILDNMLRGGKVADNTNTNKSIEAIRRCNKLIKADSRVEAVLLPVGDGINIVRKI
jgi:caffeoyl-CoA O-methyltransferase